MDFLKKLPIGQYVAGDSGWIRRIDPRLKFLWVTMFLITPVLAGPLWRLSLVSLLLAITFFSFFTIPNMVEICFVCIDLFSSYWFVNNFFAYKRTFNNILYPLSFGVAKFNCKRHLMGSHQVWSFSNRPFRYRPPLG